MNITSLLNFQSMIIHGAQTQSNELNTFVANSIRIIVEEFFMKMAPSFIIVVSCRRISPLNFYLNILQHLFNMVDNMIVQLVFVDFEKPQQRIEGPRLYNLLLVDSLEAFLDINVGSYTNNYDINEYYHIFLMQRDRYIPSDMAAIFQYCWTFNIINCNIQIQNALEEVQMYTYFPYKPTRCGNTQPEMINSFVNNSWINETYFLPKLKNFFGCPLVAVVRHIPPYLNVIKRKGKAVSYSGFEMSLVQHLAKRMNFTLDLRETREDDRSQPIGNGALKMLTERSAHFALGFFRKRTSMSSKYTTTFPHYKNNIVSAIYLKAHTFGTFQVLYYPFRKYAWTAIIVSGIITFLVTKLLLGNNHGTITAFSIIACGLGSPITEPPHFYNSLPIFISWLWSTFILRSIYSGLLYHLFSNEVYLKLPLSLENAVHQSYRPVMNRFTFNDITTASYNGKQLESSAVIFNSTNELIALPYLEENVKQHLNAIISKDFLIYYSEAYRKPGLFYIIPEIVLQQQLCIYMSKHSFLINQFDNEIMNVHSVGLMEVWSRRFVNEKYFRSNHMHANEIIDQDDLWGIYLICGVCQLMALIIFIIEILSIRYRFLRKLFK